MTSEVKDSGARQLVFSLFAVGGSMIGGMYYTMRKENLKLKNLKGLGSPAMVASKALLLGSFLAVGSFATLSSLFIMYSGVKSFREFDDYVQKSCRTPKSYEMLLQRRAREENELVILQKKFPEKSSWELYWMQFFSNEGFEDGDEEEEPVNTEKKVSDV